MKAKNTSTKNTPSAIRKIVISSTGFPAWYVSQISANHDEETYPESKPAHSLKGMLIADEIERQKKNPPWSLVEHVIRELDPGRFNSFACLSVPGNTFVQCLRGFNGYHLEWRITNSSGNYAHYRACYPGGSKKNFELKKHNHVSDGQHRDLLKLEDVLDAFHSFHQGLGFPGSLKWRKLEI